MKERQLMKESERALSKRELALCVAFALISFTLVLSMCMKDRELRDKCIAEQVINKDGNPGKNFNFQGKDPCDRFINLGYLTEAKGYTPREQSLVRMPW